MNRRGSLRSLHIDNTTAAPARQRRRLIAVAAVLLLLMVGAGLRSIRLTDPALDFHGTRQYHSALLARKYEQALGGKAAGVDRAAVLAAAPKEIEPPIIEAITAVGWRLAGSEPLWLPRALSILAWTLGGWLLYLLLLRLASPAAGVAGVAVWSLLPFGITATRTFQPDPLMVVAIVGALLALAAHDDEPTRRRLVTAGLAGGFALLVKLPAAFFVVPVFLALTCRKEGVRSLWSRTTALYMALLVAPALLYLAYGYWVGGFLGGQEGGRILPHLLLTARFWKQWAYMVVHHIGVVLPVAAMAGILISRGRSRWLGAALGAGYIGFGVVFTLHYATHSYYHLPAVLLVSLGVGLMTDRAIPLVSARCADLPSVRVALAGIAILLVGFSGQLSLVPAGVPDATRRAEIEAPREIGSLLQHATGVVFLAPSFGTSLQFHGGVAGSSWPDGEGGATVSEAEARTTLEGIKEATGATFFVVTDMDAWQDKPGLRAHLDRHYEQLASTADYLVYDLHSPRLEGA